MVQPSLDTSGDMSVVECGNHLRTVRMALEDHGSCLVGSIEFQVRNASVCIRWLHCGVRSQYVHLLAPLEYGTWDWERSTLTAFEHPAPNSIPGSYGPQGQDFLSNVPRYKSKWEVIFCRLSADGGGGIHSVYAEDDY